METENTKKGRNTEMGSMGVTECARKDQDTHTYTHIHIHSV